MASAQAIRDDVRPPTIDAGIIAYYYFRACQ